MSDQQVNVIVVPLLSGDKPSHGYSKRESERLVGRAIVVLGSEGTRVGHIVGNYAYRHDGKERVHYGLKTRYKFSDGWAAWQGKINRSDLESSRCILLPQGKVARHIVDCLKSTE